MRLSKIKWKLYVPDECKMQFANWYWRYTKYDGYFSFDNNPQNYMKWCGDTKFGLPCWNVYYQSTTPH